jgi:hypothetical protein
MIKRINKTSFGLCDHIKRRWFIFGVEKYLSITWRVFLKHIRVRPGAVWRCRKAGLRCERVRQFVGGRHREEDDH